MDDPLNGALGKRTLRELRDFMKATEGTGGERVSLARLIALQEQIGAGTRLTIDFEAAGELGQPMVVLRVAGLGAKATVFSGLSARELEVLALVAGGLRNREIAERLFISTATVKDHVHRIFEKTGFSGRAALVAAFHAQK